MRICGADASFKELYMAYSSELYEIWDLARELLRPLYSESSFDLWFSVMEPVDITDRKFIFSIPSALKRNIISDKHRENVENALCEVLGYYIEMALLTTEEAEEYLTHGRIPTPREVKEAEPLSSLMPASVTTVGEYTFENFIVGSSNKFAHAACLAVAHSPATAYNPLYIWGPSGIGKTHLMYAIKNEIAKSDPTLKCIYVKGEDFLNEVVEAIRMQNTHAIREKYRSVDVLFIDDIQFIMGKQATQLEFFHTFDSLYVDNKQMIITSDKPPKEMKILEERLISRFESGLVADIQSPDIELRMAIIKNKAQKMNLAIPNDVVTYLADRLKNNVRQIEGSLKKLGALSLLSGTPITLEIAKGAVADMVTDREPSSVTVDKIFSAVCVKYGVTPEEVKSKKQTAAIVGARHVCVYLIRTLTDLTLVQIGELFSRDHTTAMSSFRKIEKQISADTSFEAEISELISDVKES